MKARILASIIAVMLLAGCRSYPVAQQSGKEDMAYLLLVSSDEYNPTFTLYSMFFLLYKQLRLTQVVPVYYRFSL